MTEQEILYPAPIRVGKRDVPANVVDGGVLATVLKNITANKE